MIKKLSSMLLVFVMLFGLVGCTPNTKSFFEANQKMNNWKGSQVEVNGSYTINSKKDNKKVNIPFNVKGVTQKLDDKNEKFKLKYKFDLSELVKFSVNSKAPVNFSKILSNSLEFKIEGTQDKLYIEREPIKNILNLAGINIKEINDSNAEFISINTNDLKNMNKNPMISMSEYSKNSSITPTTAIEKELMNKLMMLFEGFNQKTDFTINGNTYTYKANIEDMADDFSNLIKVTLKNYSKNKEILNPIFEKAGIKKSELNKLVKDYNEENFDKSIDKIKKDMAGSNIDLKYNFKENEVNSNIKMNLNFNNLFELNYDISSSLKKDDSVNIELPKSIIQIDIQKEMEKYLKSQMESNNIVVLVNNKEIIFKDQGPIIENQRTLIPFRAFSENIGGKVEWNDKKREVIVTNKDNKKIVLKINSKTVLLNGKKIKLDVAPKIVNNRTLVPLRFLSENLGYKVDYKNLNGLNVINLNK